MIILEISQLDSSDTIAMTPRGTLGLCCVHIAQLMTHPAIYTLPFILKLCYKPLGILQKEIKGTKRFMNQVMMDCKYFVTLPLLYICPRISQGKNGAAGISSFPH